MTWLVAQAEHNRQKVARDALEECPALDKRDIYFPLTKKPVKDRRTGRTTPQPAFFFGDYFFVKFIPTWVEDVLHARGVWGVLRYDEKPFLISDKELYLKVRSREIYGHIPLPRGWERGQRLRATSGVLSGRVGKFEEDLGRSRIVALFDFMGKDVRVELAKGSLSAVY
jgi:hypothetical protein